jgi:hypothetical protein
MCRRDGFVGSRVVQGILYPKISESRDENYTHAVGTHYQQNLNLVAPNMLYTNAAFVSISHLDRWR